MIPDEFLWNVAVLFEGELDMYLEFWSHDANACILLVGDVFAE